LNEHEYGPQVQQDTIVDETEENTETPNKARMDKSGYPAPAVKLISWI
jgi:hypothetical protein